MLQRSNPNLVPNRFWLFFTFVLSLVFLTSNSLAGDRPIKVGGVFDLTGSGVIWGKEEREGFLLAIEHLKGEFRDRDFSVVMEDSFYSNAKSVSAVQKLISVDKSDFIVGPTWEVFASTSLICEKNKVVCLAPSYNGEIFHSSKFNLNYSFTGFYDEREYASVLATELNRRGIKKIALFSAVSVYYETLVRVFKEKFSGQISIFKEFDPAFRDFRSVVSAVPDDIEALVLFLDGSGQNAKFISHWSQIKGRIPPVYSHDGIIYEPEWSSIQAQVAEIYVSKPLVDEPSYRRWAEIYRGRTGESPASPSGPIAYDLTLLAGRCFVRSDGDSLRFIKCLREVEGYSGFSGQLATDRASPQIIGKRHFYIEKFLR